MQVGPECYKISFGVIEQDPIRKSFETSSPQRFLISRIIAPKKPVDDNFGGHQLTSMTKPQDKQQT